MADNGPRIDSAGNSRDRADGPVRNISLKAAWRTEYQQHRYLEYDTDDQLKERQRNILQNTFSFDADGVFSVRTPGSVWDRLMAHVYV